MAGRSHRTWYNSAVASKKDKDDGASEDSLEEMVPMGKIAVRHELDWETKEGTGAGTPPTAENTFHAS